MAEKIFMEASELEEFFQKQSESDRWTRNYIHEMKVLELPNAPILLDIFKKDYNLLCDDEEILKCMKETGVVLYYPDETLRCLPINETAITTLIDRAGIGKGALFKKIRPHDLETILNIGFSYFENKALVLVRDNAVATVKSGDVKDYAILPKDKLIECLKKHLVTNFSEYKFVKGCYDTDTDIVNIDYSLEGTKATTCINEINAMLVAKGKPALNGYVPMLRFQTSDVSNISAKIIPFFMNKKYKTYMPLTTQLSVEHRYEHTVDDFAAICNQIYSMFKNGKEKLKELMDIPIYHPTECFKNICNKLVLPIKEVKEAYDMFSFSLGTTSASAFDVYCGLNEIIPLAIDNGASSLKIIELEEKIAQAMTILLSNNSREALDMAA